MFSGGSEESIGKDSVTPFQLSVVFSKDNSLYMKCNTELKWDRQ